MGSDHSKGKEHERAAKFGQIYLQTDKATYFAGETVTGKVYLHLVTPYPGHQLFLKIKGTESTHFVRQKQEHIDTQQRKSRLINTLNQEKREIIKKSVLLHRWQTSNLQPAQYEIPFAFLLPQDLPSTFYQEGYKHLAQISYRIEVILMPTAIKKDPRIKYKQNLIVRQPVKNALQSVENSIRTKLTTCSCCNNGFNLLTAHFEKNFYCPGETARVIVSLNNSQSKLDNTMIRFNLKQKFIIKAKGKEQVRVLTKGEKELKGIPSKSPIYQSAIDIQIPSFQGAEEYQKMKKRDLLKHILSLHDNNNVLNSTTRSILVTSEYYLEITCPMDGCCVATPTISCPIEIYYPEAKIQPIQEQIQIPETWSPNEIDCVNVAFGPSLQQPEIPQQMQQLEEFNPAIETAKQNNNVAVPLRMTTGQVNPNEIMMIQNPQNPYLPQQTMMFSPQQTMMPNNIPGNLMTQQVVMQNPMMSNQMIMQGQGGQYVLVNQMQSPQMVNSPQMIMMSPSFVQNGSFQGNMPLVVQAKPINAPNDRYKAYIQQ